MATDDRFKQYSAAGEDFLEAARSRAVDFLRELGRAGQSTQKQATDQVEDLVGAGRKGTDFVLDVIRKEIAAQLGALGLATKSDLVDLEQKLSGAPSARRAPSAARAPAKKAPAKRAPAKRAQAAKKVAAQRGTAAAGAAARLDPTSAAPRKAPAKKVAGADKRR